MTRVAATLAALICLPMLAAAELIYPVQQDRTLEVLVSGWDWDTQSELSFSEMSEAETMATWQDGLLAELPGDPGDAVASAGQHSLILDDGLEAYGAADAYALDTGAFGPFADAQNHFRVRFAAAAPITYNLTGYISAETPVYYSGLFATAHVTVRLNQVAGDELYFDEVYREDGWYPGVQWHTISAAGQLGPGVYELDVLAAVQADSEYADALSEATYLVVIDFGLAPIDAPCGGDLDNDGDFDLADLALMQTCMTGPMP